MSEAEPIQPGKTYWVEMDNARFKVRAIRPSALKGWWHCEGVDTGDRLVIPEANMKPVTG